MFGDGTVAEWDALLEKTYPGSFHKLVRIRQASNCKSKHLSVWCTNIHEIKAIKPTPVILVQ